MAKSKAFKTIREYLADKGSELSTPLKSLWENSRQLHDSQNDRADRTENGWVHVDRVERNIWKMINVCGKLDDFNDTELFVLSSAACCHDFDKAIKNDRQHGPGSAAFLKDHFANLGLAQHEHLAGDVGQIIAIHHLKGLAFGEKLRTLQRTGRPTPTGESIRHRLLALLLKTGDILHTDASRTRKLGTPVEQLAPLDRSKYIARTQISGWDIDGSTITIQGSVRNEQQKAAVQACEKYMVTIEWTTVAEFLESEGFPCVLKFKVEDKTQKDSEVGDKDMPESTQETGRPNIRLKQKRFLKKNTSDLMLRTSIGRVLRYPICRHFATTHAAGSAVASLSTLIMLHKIEYFQDQLATKAYEFIFETEYTPEKLKRHVTALSQVEPILSSQIIDDGPVPPNSKIGNYLKETFKALPGGEDLFDDLRSIRESLDQNIKDMNATFTEVSEDIRSRKLSDHKMRLAVKAPDPEGRLRKLFEDKKHTLLELTKQVGEVFKSADAIKNRLNEDWDKDINEVWDAEKQKHRPKSPGKVAANIGGP